MTHIGQKSTFKTIRLFCTVFCITQIDFRSLQVILQTLGSEIKEKRNHKSAYQNHQDCKNSPYLISILLIERNRLVDNFHIGRKRLYVQFQLFYFLIIKYVFTAYHFHMTSCIIGIGKFTDSLTSHITSQWTISRNHSANGPIPQPYRCRSESRNIRISFHHHISGIPHKVTLIHIHPPGSYHRRRMLRQMVKLIHNAINRIGTPVQ